MNVTKRQRNLEIIASQFETPVLAIPSIIEAMNDNAQTDKEVINHFLNTPYNFSTGVPEADWELEKEVKRNIKRGIIK